MRRAAPAVTCALLLAGGLLSSVTDASAQHVTISGTASLTVSTAAAGASLVPVTTASLTYDVDNTTGGALAVTGQIDSSLPSGLTLTANLTAPVGATSMGTQTLSTSPVTLVTAIPAGRQQTGMGIQLTLTATLAAGVVSTNTRQLTLTLVSAP